MHSCLQVAEEANREPIGQVLCLLEEFLAEPVLPTWSTPMCCSQACFFEDIAAYLKWIQSKHETLLRKKLQL